LEYSYLEFYDRYHRADSGTDMYTSRIYLWNKHKHDKLYPMSMMNGGKIYDQRKYTDRRFFITE
jgi:hypothetical protein